MKFYTKQHEHYCGIDLHIKKMYVCIINQNNEIVLHKNIDTNPELFMGIIQPFRRDIVVGVECMFTWYWIADLCRKASIDFVLGHALHMKAIHGGKAKSDKIDSRKIAALLRGGMFPPAYIYPKSMRPTRDLLRRRNHFMRKRAELFAHIVNTASQYNIQDDIGKLRKKKDRAGLIEKFPNPDVQKSIEADAEMLDAYDKVIGSMEYQTQKNAKLHDPISYALLRAISGIGKILSLVILYEIGDINSFPKVQDFASYAKLVKSTRESNGKIYGTSGKKIGNAHLRRAFSEAAMLFARWSEPAKKYKERLIKKHSKGKALSIYAHKLGRAVYFMLKNRQPFDQQTMATDIAHSHFSQIRVMVGINYRLVVHHRVDSGNHAVLYGIGFIKKINDMDDTIGGA